MFIVTRLYPGLGYDYKGTPNAEIVKPFTMHMYFLLKEGFMITIHWHSINSADKCAQWFNQIRKFNKMKGRENQL